MHTEYDEINDEGLKRLDVSGGFETPPLYFGHLRTHILNRTTRADQNQPALPDGYFEQSKAAILAKTSRKTPKTINLWYTQPVFRYAAAAGIVATLTVSLWPSRLPMEQHISAANISDEEIIHYLEQNDLRDINLSDINFNYTDPSSNEVEQYIINQSDEQLLVEHL